MATYDPYADPRCPPCDCADWGMMGCLSGCTRERYIREKLKRLEAACVDQKNSESSPCSEPLPPS